MKFKLRYFIPILLIAACTDAVEKHDLPPPLFSVPKTVELNTKGGYAVNHLTGDSINPIILKNGDTLISGKSIAVRGKRINSDSVSKPKSIVVPLSGAVIAAHSNQRKIPESQREIILQYDSIPRIRLDKIGEDDKFHFLINSFGDTVKSGVAIPVKGRTVKVIQPKPEKAMPPRFKDKVITDLQYIDVDQGMASSYVNSILEDKNGNLWFGTWGGGVTKYDGTSFMHFAEEEGLSSNIVWSILEDKNGDLWFGTEGGGVCKYNGITFTHFSEKEGMSSSFVNSIIEDKNGNLWFATNGGGISMYQPSKVEDVGLLTHYTKNEGLSNNTVKSVLEDTEGNIWIGTWGSGVTKFEQPKEEQLGSFIHFSKSEGFSNEFVATIFQDKDENIWFGTWGAGFSVLESGADGRHGLLSHFTVEDGLSNNFVKTIFEDKNGNIWLGTNGGGVNKYQSAKDDENGLFTHYTEKEGLSNNYVLSISEDSNGNLWFGTNGGGVNKYDRTSFTHFTENEGLSNNYVMSILEDTDGNLWFGTNRGGVSKYDGTSFMHFSEKEGLPNNYVTSILEDKEGNIWFGTWGGGISKYESTKDDQLGLFTHFQMAEGLSNNYVFAIVEDKRGDLWIGTNGGGVNKFEPQKADKSGLFTHFTEEEGLSSNVVWSIFEDKVGNLWFGTDGGGVTKYELDESGKQGSFTHFTEKEGLQDNHVTSILEDNNGTFWFGTSGGGVGRFDVGTNMNQQPFFTYYSENEGISHNVVWSVLEDNSGNIWFSTENGITSFVFENTTLTPSTDKYSSQNKKEEKTKLEIIRFQKNDGLKGMDYSNNSVFLDSKNRIWWGSGKSLSMLNMEHYRLANNHPKLYFRQLDINEKFIDFRNGIDSLEKGVKYSGVQDYENYPIDLELPYSQNHLTFHFSAIDWSAPHKIQYSHIMEGLNSTWSQPSAEPKADYRNLPYGDYIFVVRAIGESGEWSDSFRYKFTIHPPWWHTWWARTGYVMIAAFLIWGFVRNRTAQLKQRQKELEKEVNQATLEIREQKNEAEKQRDEVSKQKEIVEEAHKEITDSIQYAKRIQSAILPPQKLIKEHLPNSFVLYKPKDVVAGDFYWLEHKDGKVFFAAADCTGHGVPGAMVSVVCNSGLNRSVREYGLIDPATILDRTRDIVIAEFEKSEEDVQDGMDIALCTLEGNILQYAGAHNPLWIIRNGEIIETKANKQPIGKYSNPLPYTTHTFELQKGDNLYIFSDGYVDQFGGENGKKFKTRAFRELLLSIQDKSMPDQYLIIDNTFEKWKGTLEQIDDVCVIGVRVD